MCGCANVTMCGYANVRMCGCLPDPKGRVRIPESRNKLCNVRIENQCLVFNYVIK
jgi:hypothetical protein